MLIKDKMKMYQNVLRYYFLLHAKQPANMKGIRVETQRFSYPFGNYETHYWFYDIYSNELLEEGTHK